MRFGGGNGGLGGIKGVMVGEYSIRYPKFDFRFGS